MFACWVLTGILGAIVLLYTFLEVHYFLRIFVTVFFARFCKKRVHILDETSVYGKQFCPSFFTSPLYLFDKKSTGFFLNHFFYPPLPLAPVKYFSMTSQIANPYNSRTHISVERRPWPMCLFTTVSSVVECTWPFEYRSSLGQTNNDKACEPEEKYSQ